MAGKIRNFTQETYDEFTRNMRDDFVEDNLLLGEINSAFSTPEVGEDIDVIKSHNSVTKFKGAIAQFYLNKVFRDVYEVEQEYVGHFDEIVQTIHLKTRNLKYLTDSIGNVTDPSISTAVFASVCRKDIAQSIGLEYWEYVITKPVNQLTEEEYKMVAEKIEEMIRKPESEITDEEYSVIADRLVKVSQAGDTNEMETILSWCYENEYFTEDTLVADNNPIPYNQLTIIVNQNGKMQKLADQLDNMLIAIYNHGNAYNENERNVFGWTVTETRNYEKDVLQMSSVLKGLIHLPDQGGTLNNSLCLSHSEQQFGDPVFRRDQLFKAAYLEDEEDLHQFVDRYLENGKEIKEKDLVIYFNNGLRYNIDRYSDGHDMHYDQYMTVEYPKSGGAAQTQIQGLAFNKLAEGLLDSPQEVIGGAIQDEVVGAAMDTGKAIFGLSKKANIWVNTALKVGSVGGDLADIPAKENLFNEQKDTILNADIIKELNLTSSRVVYSIDGRYYKTDEYFTLHGNSTTSDNLETLKNKFIEYGVDEERVNSLSVQDILNDPQQYMDIRAEAEENGYVDINEITRLEKENMED